MSSSNHPEKRDSYDFTDELRQFRRIAVADINKVVGLAGNTKPPESSRLHKDGAALIELRFWVAAAAAAQTVTLNFYLYPARGRQVDKTALSNAVFKEGKGVVAGILVLTFSADPTTVNINPIDGTVETVTFYEASSPSTITYLRDPDIIKCIPTTTSSYSAGNTHEMAILVDFLGYESLYIEPTAAGTVTEILIGYRRVT